MTEPEAKKACSEWEKIEDPEVLKSMTESNFPMWKLSIEDGFPKISRNFTCKNFQAAIDFLVAAGHM